LAGDPGSRVYYWSDSTLTLSGMSMDTSKDISLEINRNLEAPHYVAGSRDIGTPFAGNQNYTLSVTTDLDGEQAMTLYKELYKTNGLFNTVWDFDADRTAGSQHTVFTMSGCTITSMEAPSTTEGVVESTIEIRPQSITGSAWDQVGSYNPW